MIENDAVGESCRRIMILMPWGRVGSNLLVSQMQSAVSALDTRFSNEVFNRMYTVEEQVEWIRDFYTCHGREVLLVSKQSLKVIRKRRPFAKALNDLDIWLVRQRRRNLVKVAVSQMRGEIYARKTEEEEGVRYWGVRRGNKPLPPTPLDPNEFVKRLHIAKRSDLILRRFQHDQPVYDLDYEDLKANPAGIVRSILEWRGVPVSEIGAVAEPRFVKATPDRLSDAVPNLEELRAAASDMRIRGLDAMFDE